jgi:hypothetical protein
LLDAHVSEPEAFGVRDSTDGQQHAVALNGVRAVNLDHAALADLLGALHARAELEDQALALEDLPRQRA